MSDVDANEEGKIQIIGCTRSGKPKIIFDGYTYSFEKRNRKNTLNLWRCRHDNRCNGRIHSDVYTDIVVALLGFHSHPRSKDPQVVKEVSDEMDQSFATTVESEPKNDNELLDDELLGTGPVPSQQSFPSNMSVKNLLCGDDRHGFNQKLIQEVKSNPILYDPSHSHYTNFHKKKEVWESIAGKLSAPVENVRMRWRTLRNRFCTEWRRNISECPAFSTVQLRSFAFMQEMQFLIDYISSGKDSVETQNKADHDEVDYEKSVKNNGSSKMLMNCSTGEYDDPCLCCSDNDGHSKSFKESRSDSEVTVFSAAQPGSSNGRKRHYPSEDVLLNKGLLRAEDLMMNHVLDEDELFGQSVTVKLRKIADCTSKERLKMHILQCFVDYSEKYEKNPRYKFD